MTSTSMETLSAAPDIEKTNYALERPGSIENEEEQRKLDNIADSAVSDKDPYLVFLEPEESPHSLSSTRKASIVLVISVGALCSTFASSIVSRVLISTYGRANSI
jgi:hypothetical protein